MPLLNTHTLSHRRFTDGRDSLEQKFLRSITLCVCLSSLILAQSEGAWFPVGVTPVLALLAYLVTDRRHWFSLPIYAANILGGLAAMATLAEFFTGDIEGKLLSGAHMLVYLTWIVLLMRKGIRQFWWLSALTVLQLAVASVLTREPVFGASLAGMLLLLIWTLSVFTLYRVRGLSSADSLTDSTPTLLADSLAGEQRGAATPGLVVVRNGLQIDATDSWTGWRFCGIVLWTFLGSLIVASVVFAAFPRIWVDSPLAPVSGGRNAFQHRTGFTEAVQLGEIGEIMQSDTRVMQFSIRELKSGRPVTVEQFISAMGFDELRFRGNVLSRYENGRWSRPPSHDDRPLNSSRSPALIDRANPYAVSITQDPPVGRFAFAVMPLIDAVSINAGGGVGAELSQRQRTQTLLHRDADARTDFPVTYEIHCPRLDLSDPDAVRPWTLREVVAWLKNSPALTRNQREEIDQSVQNDALTPQLGRRLPKLVAAAEAVCRADDAAIPGAATCVARTVEYLSQSGEFTYSLTQRFQDPGLDPVEDFLVNHKTGHCEYFASSCALMLQAVDIPARVVNGFKGSEVNAVSGQHEVKQKHAHTWVEAWVDGHWVTVDPTPASERDENVMAADSLSWLTDLRGALTDQWYLLIQRMSLERQQALIQPALTAAKDAAEVIRKQGLLAAAKLFFREYVMSPKTWFSLQGGLITFVLLLLISLIFRRRPWRILFHIAAMLRQRFSRRGRAARSVIRFYESFREICERHGLPLSETSTALENAIAARHFFAHILTTDDVAVIPERVAAAFNSVRFGEAELSPEQASSIRGDVHRLAQRLEAGPQASGNGVA